MKRFAVDPTSDLSQKHSFAIAMATLIHNGFNLCDPITMQQEEKGIGNIVFTQGERRMLPALVDGVMFAIGCALTIGAIVLLLAFIRGSGD